MTSNGSKSRVLPDIAPFLLDLANSLKIGCSVECVTAIKKKFNKVSRYMTTSNIETACQVLRSKTLIHWNLLKTKLVHLCTYISISLTLVYVQCELHRLQNQQRHQREDL